MNHIPEPSGKSLLLQTVALFETLLSKITSMKKENEEISTENLRLSKSLELKCSVEDNLRDLESKLQATNEVNFFIYVNHYPEIISPIPIGASGDITKAIHV